MATLSSEEEDEDDPLPQDTRNFMEAGGEEGGEATGEEEGEEDGEVDGDAAVERILALYTDTD